MTSRRRHPADDGSPRRPPSRAPLLLALALSALTRLWLWIAAGILLMNRLIDKGPDALLTKDPPEQPSKRTLKATQDDASVLFGDGHPGDDKIQPAN